MRICLVTEELAGVGGSGGIGAAFAELATLLARKGAVVDVVYCPVAELGDDERRAVVDRYARAWVKLDFIDYSLYAQAPYTLEKRSYSICRLLEERTNYDVVHFHDYKGLGFFSVSSKAQGLAFESSLFVVQLHGPTSWTLDANDDFATSEEHLRVDFLERESIRLADFVVSPSQYLVDWLRADGFVLPSDDRVLLIKNVCSDLITSVHAFGRKSRGREGRVTGKAPRASDGFTDVVFFARHEERKGFILCLDALDELADEIADRRIRVHFFGKLGDIDGKPSLLWLVERSSRWEFEFSVNSNLDRGDACRELLEFPRPLVVVPSPYENSPYTVLEVAALGLPLIASLHGGGPELLEEGYAGLFPPERMGLADKMRSALRAGLVAPSLRESMEEVERQWLKFHEQLVGGSCGAKFRSDDAGRPPRVCFGITHFERPRKLVDAVMSAARQDYPNLEIVVVDDGSTSETTLEELEKMRVLFDRLGVKFIRRPNGYLGAARNTILANTDAEYLVFLDDDDIARPDLVSTLVRAARATDADVVNCASSYMDVKHRHLTIGNLGSSETLLASFVPAGGPFSLAIQENCLGGAVALLRASTLRRVGGYTELWGVGHEDYELYLRMLQAGARLQVVPRVLYHYEVGRPSMLTRTSMRRSFRRTYRAISSDVVRGPARDFLGLTLGKLVAERVRGQQWWLASSSPHAALIHAALHGGATREDLYTSCISLARKLGNPRVADAIALDYARWGGRPAPEETLVPCDGVVRVSALPPELAAVEASLLIDAALGRYEDALGKLGSLFTESKVVPLSRFEFAFRVIQENAKVLERSAVASIVAKMSESPVDSSERDAILPIVAAVSALGDCWIGSPVLDSIARRCVERYCSANADVAKGLATGEVDSAVSHYLRFGEREGRSGFEALEAVVALAGRLGVPLSVRSLAERALGNSLDAMPQPLRSIVSNLGSLR